uniref:NB-ARC domain-containing protein n=2 Tax=Oryza TaxID=4527 RepID=A0A0E0H2J4_ORYNI
MAGLISSGIIKWTASKLSSLVSASPGASASNEQSSALRDVRTLQRTMARIQRTLATTDEHSIRDASERLHLRELQQFAYDAQDAIDLYKFELLRRRMDDPNSHGDGGSSRKRKHKGDKKEPETEPEEVSIPDELAVRVRKILERFKEITKAWDDLRLDDTDTTMQDEEHSMLPLPTTPYVDEPTIFGRDEDKEKIIKMLLSVGGANEGDVSVLPIIGMGGVGKTALVQLVYNDRRILNRFDLMGWVHVSENFDLKSIMRKIIMSFTKKPCQMTQMDQLQYMLIEQVVGRKFLLVLDDVWNERKDIWDALLSAMSPAQSSIILVTTRNTSVSTIVQTMHPYNVSCLPFEESWQLFKQMAFLHQDESMKTDFEVIGRKIVQKCAGLPLAVKAIASALRFEENEEKWNDILESEQWELPTTEDTVLPALKLSYDQMPIHLKRCFVFFALFPKRHVFLKENVVYLWISLGFLKRTSQTNLETIARCLNDLMQRTMVQKILFDGGHDCFTMHDLVHDLAASISYEDILRIDTQHMKSMNEASGSLRYLSLVVSSSDHANLDLRTLPVSGGIRIFQVVNSMDDNRRYFSSFFKNNRRCFSKLFSHHINLTIDNELWSSFRHLRTLDLSRSSMTALPDSIRGLKLLRYLSIFQTRISKLPESICDLLNLKILDARTNFLEELPQGIQKLVKLQHLNLVLWSPLCMPKGIGNLTKLQTLTRYSVGSGNWHCNIAELHYLVNIHGELTITGLGRVTKVDDAQTANLINKEHVQTLRLDWSDGFYSSECDHNSSHIDVKATPELAEEVFESLKPTSNLEELEVADYFGYKYPSWFGGSAYSQLAKITLWKQGCKFLPTLGQLPQLRKLVVIRMEEVERIGQEFHGENSTNRFPVLEELEFENMPKWVEWTGVFDGDFPSLRELKIKDSGELRTLPHQLSSSLKKLVIKKCEKLTRLPTIPNLTILLLMGNLSEEIHNSLDFPMLQILKVCFTQKLVCLELDNKNLPILEALAISGCRGLFSVVGLFSLESLKLLKIKDCPNLQCPLQPLQQQLQQCIITNCPQLQEWIEWQQSLIDKEDKQPEFDNASYDQEALGALSDNSEDDVEVFNEDEDDDFYDEMLEVGQSSGTAINDDDGSNDAV